jgi:hypothetical protein
MVSSIASVKSDVFIWLGVHSFTPSLLHSFTHSLISIIQSFNHFSYFSHSGDIVYTDKMGLFSFTSQASDLESVRNQFKVWKNSASNAKLENSTNLLMAVWDDHDFGINDGGSEHVHKSATQQIFLDFLGVPADSPRRKRQGVYSSQVIGDIGQRVRIILLDVRYHRDAIGSDGDLLGAEQWLWLERELREEERVDMTVIGSGIQVLNDWRPSENWGRFPSERNRLLRLLGDSNTTGVMFISGDVHFAEFTEVKCDGESHQLVDFTSSGISHSLDEEVNSFVRPWVCAPASPHAYIPLPTRHRHPLIFFLSQVESVYLCSPLSLAQFTGRNFGRIAVDWASREVTLTALDQFGTPQLTKTLKLDEMRPRQGGECYNIGRSSTGLKLVTRIRSVFPQLSNSQCIVAAIVLVCILAPSVITMALVCAARVLRSKKSSKIHKID